MVVEKIEKQEMEIAQIVLAISMEKLHTILDKNLFTASHLKTFL